MRGLFLSFLIIICFIAAPLSAQGFLKTQGKKIVDGSGNEVILRGMGLGGWMLQEGYMLQTASFASAQHELEAAIEELIGAAGKDQFYEAWLNKNTRKADIDSLAAWGFNSVRLPMHYKWYTLPIEEEPVSGQNTWLQKGFALTDSLLSWCSANNMYLILDLHGAPGGQGREKGISDYDDSKPSLWESADNRSKTVALWRELARRYADEPWIGGYDLLNETNWDLPGNAMLKILYLDITKAIREVDQNHLIFIEGNWFANDFTGLTPPWDSNMAYSFHKYWSHNNQGSIQWMLNIRNTYNVPIWCGESGENSNVWYNDAIRLMESFDIGWAWWPLKKVESISGPLAIKKPAGFQTLIDYWEGRGSKPSAEFASQVLLQLAENSKAENCEFHKDLIDAMFRQVKSAETIPYKNHTLPGILPVAEYDMGRLGSAYYDTEVADYHVSTGTWTTWNSGWAFRNDGVDVEPSKDSGGSPYSVGWIAEGEWLQYTVNVLQSDTFDITFRIASADGRGRLQLLLDSREIIPALTVPNTGGWFNWQDAEVKGVYIPGGAHTLRLQFPKEGLNINQITFVGRGAGETANPTAFSLGQNYPNPFNGTTKIPLLLAQGMKGTLKIFDLTGRLVRRYSILDQREQIWDGRDGNGQQLASGVYFYQLKSGAKTAVRSMVLLR